MGLVSIASNGQGGWHGFAAGGGAYFEASLSFDPNIKAKSWPAFWSTAAEGLCGNDKEIIDKEIIEVDFFEYDTLPYDGDIFGYGGAIHVWVNHTDVDNNTKNAVIKVSHNVDWENSFNTVGCLWIPGIGINMYFNNAITTDQNPYSRYPGFQFADNQHWPVILGSDDWPMKVDWVRVWQKP